jgi:hypothetical protein
VGVQEACRGGCGSTACVRAHVVLNSDQRVIDLWDIDRTGPSCGGPFQIASKTAPADRRKAIGRRIREVPAISTGLQRSPDPAPAENPSPPPPGASGPPGRFLQAHKKFPQLLGTCPTCELVKSDGESGLLHSCCRKMKIQDCISIYLGRRDRKRLFTFTFHCFSSGGSRPSDRRPCGLSLVHNCSLRPFRRARHGRQFSRSGTDSVNQRLAFRVIVSVLRCVPWSAERACNTADQSYGEVPIPVPRCGRIPLLPEQHTPQMRLPTPPS